MFLIPQTYVDPLFFDNELLVKVRDQFAPCDGGLDQCVELLSPLVLSSAVKHSKIVCLYTSPPLFLGVIIALLCPSLTKFRSLLHLLVCFLKPLYEVEGLS